VWKRTAISRRGRGSRLDAVPAGRRNPFADHKINRIDELFPWRYGQLT